MSCLRLIGCFLLTTALLSTSASAQVWNPFAKKKSVAPYRPVIPATAQMPINAKLPQMTIPSFPGANGSVAPASFVERWNTGTKNRVDSIGKALTLPKISLPGFGGQGFKTPQIQNQNPFLRPLTAGLPFKMPSAKPRKSLLPGWLTAKPAPQQPPTLQDWLARPRPQ